MAWSILAVVLLLAVTVSQQMSAFEAGEQPGVVERLAPPGATDPGLIQGKLLVRLGVATGGGAAMLSNLPAQGLGVVDRYRNMTARAALAGGEGELDNLGELEAELEDPGFDTGLSPGALEELRADVGLTLRVYEDPKYELDAAQREGLVARHGFFGRLVGVQNLPKGSAEWREVLGGGEWLFLVLMVAGGWIGLLFVGGLVCAVLAVLAMSRSSVWRFRPPAPGGSVHIETLCVFVLAFVVLKVVAGSSSMGTLAHLAAQWLLLPTILWPLLRGVRWGEYAAQVGWHRGRGVWREVGAGVFGYFAVMPIFVAGVAIALIGILFHALSQESSGQPRSLPQNPVQELIAGSGGVELVMLFVLATAWAPIVEETVFRGALYRHLRGYAGVVISAALSALAFGLMHGYAWFLLAPVIALGAGFALIREWRGSLIASMTAHALHNGAVLAFALTLFGLLKD